MGHFKNITDSEIENVLKVWTSEIQERKSSVVIPASVRANAIGQYVRKR